MRKLKLDPYDLRVETFATGDHTAVAGTVRAHAPFEIPATDDVACTGGGSATEGQSCYCTNPHTCAATCHIVYCTDTTCLTYDYCCP